MDEETLMNIARQLRKPEGEFGIEVAKKMNSGNELMNRRTITKLDPQPFDYILEIGMGNGFFVKDILNIHPSIKYFGCDYSELMIKEAVRLNLNFVREWRAFFYLASGNQLPFDIWSMNKIFSVNTIYFWDNPAVVFSEVKRVLKPSGNFIITFRPERVMNIIPVTRYGFKMYSPDKVEKLLITNGFDIISIEEEDEPGTDIEGNEVTVASVVVVSRVRQI